MYRAAATKAGGAHEPASCSSAARRRRRARAARFARASGRLVTGAASGGGRRAGDVVAGSSRRRLSRRLRSEPRHERAAAGAHTGSSSLATRSCETARITAGARHGARPRPRRPPATRQCGAAAECTVRLAHSRLLVLSAGSCQGGACVCTAPQREGCAGFVGSGTLGPPPPGARFSTRHGNARLSVTVSLLAGPEAHDL